MVSAPARRRQVEFAVERGLSCRRACSLLSVARSALTYTSRLDERDREPLKCLRELAQEYPRWGYRRMRVMLERRGFTMSTKRAHRLWKKAELQVPRRRRQRRVASSRPRPQPASGANQVWAYDFVFDACANGQKLKCLTVIDEWTREVLAIDVAGRLRSGRVIDVLSRLVSERGAPQALRSDNGPEFVSMAVLGWLQRNGIETAFIAPGKPWENGMNESFNGKFRDECLNLEWFRTRAEARVLIEAFRRRYNEERPHSSLDYMTPGGFSRANKQSLTPEACVR
jgi:putative transposase